MEARRSPRPLPKRWAIALGLSWACVACGGNAVGSKASEPDSAGAGSGLAGGKTSGGGSSSGGSAVALGGSSSSSSSGGATDTPPKVSCQDLRDEAPGKPVYDLSLVGAGACQGITLGDTIDRIHAEHPELADVATLYAPDPERGGDGSFIYAFQKPDGTFALVFKRGGGDCPAGCTENDYWYFDTVGHCDISPEGHTRRAFDGACLPIDQLPQWGIPPAAPPESICGASAEPQDLSGDYAIYLCGQGSKCATSSEGAKSTDLPNVVKLHITQDAADLAHGTVTLSGTGEPLLDDRELTADFARRHFHAEEHVSNLPATCPETHDLTLDYDFEGFGQRHLSFFQTATPDCAAKPNDYCKGSLEADLGRQVIDP
jgi:hypothetical protein